ncbi:MAG: ATP-binding protein [Melioribacteraceae bacterium]|nr:ATP-binding protein [Melioribacteraceae bacterium]
MIKRSLYLLFKKRILAERMFLQILSGPRQVGKTTLIRQILDEIDTPSLYVTSDAIPGDSQYWISQQWETARIRLKQNPKKELILVFDEIQKITNWSETVKKEWDRDTIEKTNIKVVLLGSSQLQMQQGLTESLTGRFETFYLPQRSYVEMNKAFGINHQQFVWFGGYPGMASLINDEKRWKDYMINSIIETTISKDILMMNRIDKPALLRRLFELGCLYSGQILSLSKIVGQLQDAGNTTTLSNYIRLLDGAGMLSGLEKTYIEKVRTRASSPKFQVQNNGLMNALRNETFETAQNQTEVWGRIIESAIGAHLLNFSKQEGFALEYWRHKNNEIDFVIRKNNKIIGIEVKSNANYKTSGMKEFEKVFKPDKIMLVGMSGLPWQEFLEINPVELL